MLLVALYLFAAIAANLLVAWLGPWSTPFVGLALIGLDLSTRDKLHDRWAGNHLWLKMFILILTGSIISWLLNADAKNIAIASTAAFAIAGIADAVIYHLLRNKHKLIRVNGSNIVSSIADSFTFPTIAFGMIIPHIILLQCLAKIFGGFLWGLILFKGKRINK